jgi:uncharacterized protein
MRGLRQLGPRRCFRKRFTGDAVIEEFVTRDTTDYGERERSLAEKVEDVMRQFRRGEAKVVFDGETGTVNIVVARFISVR